MKRRLNKMGDNPSRAVNQYRLAKDTGINRAHINRMFNRQSFPSFPTACRIADALGWSLDELAEELAVRDRLAER